MNFFIFSLGVLLVQMVLPSFILSLAHAGIYRWELDDGDDDDDDDGDDDGDDDDDDCDGDDDDDDDCDCHGDDDGVAFIHPQPRPRWDLQVRTFLMIELAVHNGNQSGVTTFHAFLH